MGLCSLRNKNLGAKKMNMPIVQAQNLEMTYRSGGVETHALRGVDIEITKGEMVAVMGPSGCGKTTLLNCLSGIDQATAGKITIEGTNLIDMSDNQKTKYRAENMGFIFQTFNLLPVLTSIENVELPLLVSGTGTKKARQEAQKALESVGLGEYGHHKPAQLSGGQRQRVSIARTLIMKPKFVVCDEPTSMLDVSIRISIMDLMLNLAKDLEVSYLYITHDLAVARYMCNRIAVMFNGKIVEIAETEELLNNPVHPYTKRLISSIPVPDPTYDRKVYDINFDELDSLIEKHGSDSPMIDIGNQHYVATHDVKGLI